MTWVLKKRDRFLVEAVRGEHGYQFRWSKRAKDAKEFATGSTEATQYAEITKARVLYRSATDPTPERLCRMWLEEWGMQLPKLAQDSFTKDLLPSVRRAAERA
jgi:hypothetical protein